jgi:hypothetical protein
MRSDRTTILALALVAGTVLGLAAAPAIGQAAVTPTAVTCTPTKAAPVCGVEIFTGGGVKTPVAEPLPAPGGIAASTAPKKVEVATPTGTTTLKMDVASLQKPYGDCSKHCSDWWVYHNGALQVVSFSWDKPTGTVTAHLLVVPGGSSSWRDMGKGIYTPLYFQWLTGTSTYYCMHLDLPTAKQPKATYDWSQIGKPGAPNCP